jgi:hypothetical protein
MFAIEFFIPYILNSIPIIIGAIVVFINQVASAIGDELIRKV